MEFFQGLSLLAANPRLWSHSLRPMGLAFAAYVGLGAVAWVLLTPFAARWAAQFGVSGWVGGLAASALLVVVWVVLFSTLFVALAGVFGGFLWEKLAAEVEEIVSTQEGFPIAVDATTPLTTSAVVADSLARLVLAGAVGVAALIVAILTGPLATLVGWAAAGFLALLDYTAPASLCRGWTLREQMARLLRPSSVPFAAVVGIVSLIPFVNLLLWPASIAGGTLLVRRSERPLAPPGGGLR